MPKPHVTRTLAPIHFEDLDPHRFEDLVRQLAYDFKQWQSIESTGRGGADDGFDIRAYEVLSAPSIADDEDNQEDAPHPMDGNLWMIQCKREKELGPKRVKDIITDAVNPDTPPYGYILAASAHFSKTAHDRFRQELRDRGVMEFYLWGAGELEDMLYQPKNDHILFAFFGISIASRRRSRATQIRATVSIKNKLRRALGDNPSHKPVLLRDLQDVHYPYEDAYKDFAKRPRWEHLSAVAFHPLGLIVSVARYYAYVNRDKAEWDFTDAVNTVMPVHTQRRRPRPIDNYDLRNAVHGFWEQLPRSNRTTFVYDGFVSFDSIVFIDDKGDTEYDCPHLFVEFHGDRGAFSGRFEYLEKHQHQHESLNGLKRVEIFPANFPNPSFGTIYKDRFITVDGRTRSSLNHRSDGITLYDADKKYSYLKPTDVIGVDETKDEKGNRILVKITNVRGILGKTLLAACEDSPPLTQAIESQIPRQLNPDDAIQIIEAIAIYDWQIDQNRPVV